MKPNAAIIGASREKSLFLRMIADLDPNEGKVFLGDLPRASMPATRWRQGNVVATSATRNLAHEIPEFRILSAQPGQSNLRGVISGCVRTVDISKSPLTGRSPKRGPHTQRSHIYSCKRFAAFLKRSPDTATPVALATVWRRNAHHHL